MGETAAKRAPARTEPVPPSRRGLPSPEEEIFTPRTDRPVGLMVMGVPADAKVLEAYAASGFQRAVHWLPSAPRGPVERALDRFEAAVAEFHGE